MTADTAVQWVCEPWHRTGPSYVKSMPLYYAAHLDWFHRYLGGGPSPYDIKKMVRGPALKK